MPQPRATRRARPRRHSLTIRPWAGRAAGPVAARAPVAASCAPDAMVRTTDRAAADGVLACRHQFTTPDVPTSNYPASAHASEGRYVSVDAGDAWTCAVPTAGQVECYGGNDASASPVVHRASSGRFDAIALGGVSRGIDAASVRLRPAAAGGPGVGPPLRGGVPLSMHRDFDGDGRPARPISLLVADLRGAGLTAGDRATLLEDQASGYRFRATTPAPLLVAP